MVPRWLQRVYWIMAWVAIGAWGWGVWQAWSRGKLFAQRSAATSLSRSQGKAAQVGQVVPPLRVKTPQGAPASLRSYRGKWVLLNFWATWCEPCRREMASLERLARQLSSKRFALIAVSVDNQWSAVKAFFKQAPSLRAYALNSLHMKMLWDPLGPNANRYGTQKFPETYLIDPDGRLRRKWIGPFAWDSPSMIKQIKTSIQVPGE